MTVNVALTATGIKDSEGFSLPDGPFLASDNAVFTLVGSSNPSAVYAQSDPSNGVVSGVNLGDTFSIHCEIGGVAVGTDAPWTVGGVGPRSVSGFTAAFTDVA